MFEAQLLIAKGAEAYKVLSPWMQRQGDNVTFTVETVQHNGDPTLDVHMFTKNSETAGKGSDPDTSIKVTAPSTAGQTAATTWTGEALELVRYEFQISGDAGDWILFRMLSPVWFDDVSGG